jgi:hypothetical protein
MPQSDMHSTFPDSEEGRDTADIATESGISDGKMRSTMRRKKVTTDGSTLYIFGTFAAHA